MTPGRIEAGTVAIGGRRVRVTNPDRVLWPRTGATKRDLLDYLLAVAPVLLPHLAMRATMLWRYPEGVEGPGWFQANCRGAPDWVRTHPIVGGRGETLRYCLVEETATLAWLGNIGTIELHPHGWTIDTPNEATALVLDLDPGPPAGLLEAARVALLLRARLVDHGLAAWIKTSGGLGLHVAAPLGPGASFDEAKAFARALAAAAARDAPDRVTDRPVRAERAGRVFVDWIQNDANRQLVAPYSLRATPEPRVATPVSWDEVEAAVARSCADGLRFGPADVLDRLDRLGDLSSPSGGAPGPQRLPVPPDVDAS